MNYREPKAISREALEQILARDEPDKICAAIVGGAHSILDSAWMERTCIHLLAHSDISVRGTAVTCLGHIARIHRKTDVKLVEQALRALYLEDQSLRGRIQDAADDIRVFVGEDIDLLP